MSKTEIQTNKQSNVVEKCATFYVYFRWKRMKDEQKRKPKTTAKTPGAITISAWTICKHHMQAKGKKILFAFFVSFKKPQSNHTFLSSQIEDSMGCMFWQTRAVDSHCDRIRFSRNRRFHRQNNDSFFFRLVIAGTFVCVFVFQTKFHKIRYASSYLLDYRESHINANSLVFYFVALFFGAHFVYKQIIINIDE